MSLTLYQNSFGRNYTFQLFERDGITPRNISGLTIIWRFKDANDPTNLKSITCVPTDTSNGKFYGAMITGITETANKTWICQIELSQSGVLLDPSEPFVANVEKSAAVAG